MKLDAFVVRGLGHAVFAFGRRTFFFNVEQLRLKGPSLEEACAKSPFALQCSENDPIEGVQSDIQSLSLEDKTEKQRQREENWVPNSAIPVDGLSGLPLRDLAKLDESPGKLKEWISKWQICAFGLMLKPDSQEIVCEYPKGGDPAKYTFVNVGDITNIEEIHRLRRVYAKRIRSDLTFSQETTTKLTKVALQRGLISPYWLTASECHMLGLKTTALHMNGVKLERLYVNAQNTDIGSERRVRPIGVGWLPNTHPEKSSEISTDAITGETIEASGILSQHGYVQNAWVCTDDIKHFDLKHTATAKTFTIHSRTYLNVQDCETQLYIDYLRSVYPKSLSEGPFPRDLANALLSATVLHGLESPLWASEKECTSDPSLNSQKAAESVVFDGKTYFNIKTPENSGKAVSITKPTKQPINPAAHENVTFVDRSELIHPPPPPAFPSAPTRAITGEPIHFSPALSESALPQRWVSPYEALLLQLKVRSDARLFMAASFPQSRFDFYNVTAVVDQKALEAAQRTCPRSVVSGAFFHAYTYARLRKAARLHGFTSVHWATKCQWAAMGIRVLPDAHPTFVLPSALFINGSETSLISENPSLKCQKPGDEGFLAHRPRELELSTAQCTQCYASALQRLEERLSLADQADLTVFSTFSALSDNPTTHRRVCGKYCHATPAVAATTKHVLSSCCYALHDGRFTLRHDAVLAVLERYLMQNPAVDAYHTDVLRPADVGSGRTLPDWIRRSRLRPDGWVQLDDGREFVLELSCPWEDNLANKHEMKTSKYTACIQAQRQKHNRTTFAAFEFTARGVPHGTVGALREVIGLGDEVFAQAVEDMAEAVMLTSLHVFQLRGSAEWAPPAGVIAARLQELTGKSARALWEATLYANVEAGWFRKGG